MKLWKNRTIFCLLLTAYCLLFTINVYASVWQKPVLIDAGTGDAFRTNIAFDPYGNAIAVFEQYTDASQGYMQTNFYLIKTGGRDLLSLMQDQGMHMYQGLPLTRAVMPSPSSSRVMEAYIVSMQIILSKLKDGKDLLQLMQELEMQMDIR